jgi:hypothetical protein
VRVTFTVSLYSLAQLIWASVTTGTTCSGNAAAEPSTRTVPVTASSGTVTIAEVPSSATIVGRTTFVVMRPYESTTGKMILVSTERFAPESVIVSPGLAEAMSAFAGVPLAAVPARPVTATDKTVLVPPGVVTVIGPTGASDGSVSLSSPFTTEPFRTTIPPQRLVSKITRSPIVTRESPSANPLPVSVSVLPP